MAEQTTGNPLLDIISEVGESAKPNPAPSSKPAPGTAAPKISPPKGTIKVNLGKYIGKK
jgi:hypothetical protein